MCWYRALQFSIMYVSTMLQGGEDPFKEWGKMAESVGQTLTEGFTMVTETLSSWLSGPFDDEEEQDARQRPAFR